MSQKIEITKKVLEIIDPNYDEKTLKKSLRSWWVSTRKKETGGLRLTEVGFQSLQQSQIKHYKIKLQNPVEFNNQYTIWFDKFINCPWFLTRKEIYVYNAKMAFELVLFEGNIKEFVTIKAKKQE